MGQGLCDKAGDPAMSQARALLLGAANLVAKLDLDMAGQN